MNIRVATEQDVYAFQRLTQNTPWRNSNFIERELRRGNVSVAAENDVVLGLIISNREFFERPFIWLVLVDEAHRRTGVATRLFDWIESRYPEDQPYTSTNTSNQPMRVFLEARGYSVIGEIDLDPADPEIVYRLTR